MQENQYRRFRPAKTQEMLQSLTERCFQKRGFFVADVLLQWPKIVGKELAQYSAPVRLSFPAGKRRDGCLVIAAPSSLALDLQHMQPQILERLNVFFGYAAVARLRFEHRPISPSIASPPKLTDPAVTPPESVSEALERLKTCQKQRQNP